MEHYSAEQFRQRLAGLAAPEQRFTGAELEEMKRLGVETVKACRLVFGQSLDRKTLWERISNGIPVAAAKSGGDAERFAAAMLEYVKADANAIVGSGQLAALLGTLKMMGEEAQRQFVGTCVEYRMLLCLEAREDVEAEKSNYRAIKAQTGAEKVTIYADGSIATSGEGGRA